MSKYPTVKLGDVCDILNGFAFKSENYVKSGLRIIRISNVQKGYLEDKDPKFYPIDSIKSFNNFILKSEDILISLTGNVGRVAIIKDSFLPAVLNQRVACLRPNSGVLNPKYLFQILNSDFFEKNCINNAKGIAQKNMSTEWLKLYKIPLPNLQIQNEISTNILKITENIEKRKQQLIKLDMLAKSRFIEMFGQCGEDRFGWGVSRLGDCCIINPSKSTEARLEDELEVSFCPMPYVSESGDIKTDETKLYKDVKSGFTYFAEEDVLFAKITPCMENGKGAIARNLKNGIGFGSTEFHILRPNRSIITPEWLYVLTTFMQFRKDAEANMTGSAGQKRVPSIFLRNYKISIPPLEMQKQYVGILEQLDKSKFRIKKSLEKLEMTYKALLQEYFG